jgi:pimeloyl-ACP methyl ester carboxylesterase
MASPSYGWTYRYAVDHISRVHRCRGNAFLRGMNIHHVQAGSGTPVVLVHGWSQTSHTWRKVVPTLARHHEVYAVDLPGLGNSGFAPDGHSAMVAAELLDEWRASLGLSDVHLVGHDLGGPISYLWAADHREHVRSLTVVGVPLHGFGLRENIERAGLWHFGFFAVPGLVETLAAGRERVLLEHFFSHAMAAGAIVKSDVDEYLRTYGDFDRLVAGFEYYRAVEEDTAAIAAHARTPLTMATMAVGAGLAGGAAPIDSLRQVATRVRGEIVATSGHFVPEERPDELSELLLDFFA